MKKPPMSGGPLLPDNTLPKRIKRCRTAGWRMPVGAVYVGRPSQWGNPFSVTTSRQQAVDQYAEWLAQQSGLMLAVRHRLKGKHLACWCPLGEPCHADLLLQIANNDIDSLISANPHCPRWASALVDLIATQEAA